jgi:hypothetical protein
MDSKYPYDRELTVGRHLGGSYRGRDWYFGDGYEPREMLVDELEPIAFPIVAVTLGCAGAVSGVADVIAAVGLLSHATGVHPHTAAWEAVGYAAAATAFGRMALWRRLRFRVNLRYVLADAALGATLCGSAIAAAAGSTAVAASGALVTLAGLVLSALVLPRVRWFLAGTRRAVVYRFGRGGRR